MNVTKSNFGGFSGRQMENSFTGLNLNSAVDRVERVITH